MMLGSIATTITLPTTTIPTAIASAISISTQRTPLRLTPT